MPAERALKLGNPSKRNRKALEAAAAADQPPDTTPSPATTDLPPGIVGAAAEHWHRLHDTLTRRHHLKLGDHRALARLCGLYADYDSLMALCRNRRGRFSPTYKTKTTSGATKYAVRPEYRLAKELLVAIVTLEREFGLTPSSRATVTQKTIEARDPERPPTGPGQTHTNGGTGTGAVPQPPAPPLTPGALAPKRVVN